MPAIIIRMLQESLGETLRSLWVRNLKLGQPLFVIAPKHNGRAPRWTSVSWVSDFRREDPEGCIPTPVGIMTMEPSLAQGVTGRGHSSPRPPHPDCDGQVHKAAEPVSCRDTASLVLQQEGRLLTLGDS